MRCRGSTIPNFEVLVIDNNTRDEAVWRPVEAHCRRLGERFRFFHVAPLAGFKAGALNFALAQTAPDAEVDRGHRQRLQGRPELAVRPGAGFDNPRIAIVQAPQDYRDEHDNAFKAMCYAEYRGFFYIGMITRNERNAIIQHGTMTLVRRYVLWAVGGWAEWCITEDAELGLRVFEAGYEALYIAHSYGARSHARHLHRLQDASASAGPTAPCRSCGITRPRCCVPRSSALTAGQRYHFIAGWLPWIADGFNLLFNIAAIGWSIAMIVAPQKIDPPLMVFSVLPLSLFMFKLVKLVHLYTHRVGMNFRQTFAAAISGLALAHTIGLAVLKGLMTRNEPFFRTPKQSAPHRLLAALAAAREETLLMLGLWLSALGDRHPHHVSDRGGQSGSDRLAGRFADPVDSLRRRAAGVARRAFPLPAALLGTRYRTDRPPRRAALRGRRGQAPRSGPPRAQPPCVTGRLARHRLP